MIRKQLGSFRRGRALLPILAAACALALGACSSGGDADSSTPHFVAKVARTSHGVAHIQANDFRSLGYGLAYAYAQDNVCMFADTVLSVRGERSQFFGPDVPPTRPVNGEYSAETRADLNNEDSDFFFKGYIDLEQLKAGYAAASQEARDILTGYVAGYNRYLRDYAGKFPAACNNARWLRPISVEDLYLVIAEKALHASGEHFAAEILAGARDAGVPAVANASATSMRSDTPLIPPDSANQARTAIGSNALAIGKDLTVNGRGMLLGNPHYPWTTTDRFYQAHLTVPGRYDAMGVILGGIPIIVIGFTKDVAWSHTTSTSFHLTTFKLTLDPGDASGTSYLSDGASVKMSSRTVTVDSLMPDGSMRRRSKTFYFSKHGAVMVKPEAGFIWNASEAYVIADANRNNTRLMDQWIGIASARNVREMKASLDTVIGLPWVNTVAADRDGDTLFADASAVPHMTAAKFKSACLLGPALLTFDGSRSACDWGADANAPPGIFSPANGPWMIRADYVGNSNDSYWLTTPRALLTGPAPDGFSPMYGRTGIEQSLRTRIGFKQLEEAIAQKRRLGPADLQELVFSNRIHAAELVLPELLPLCAASADLLVARACDVLGAWDKRGNLDSRGALLFHEFWRLAAGIADKWTVALDVRDPVNTPRGLNPGVVPQMLAALRSAVQKLDALGISLGGRFGDYLGETRNGVRVPLHGAIGDADGSYNVFRTVSDLEAGGYRNIAQGTSYVQTVTFDNRGPIAQGILVYGQSVDPRSPYYADQLPLYSQKTWPVLPFNAGTIAADSHYRVISLSE